MDNYEIVFASERIYYCKINENMINDYLKMVNDPSVAAGLFRTYKEFTYEEELEWVRDKIKDGATVFSMIDKESKKFIGNVELMQIINHSAEVGISITKEMQNKHFGTEAMRTIVNYGYEVLGLNNIYLKVFDFNKRAIKCYQNVGFVEDGLTNSSDEYKMVHKRK